MKEDVVCFDVYQKHKGSFFFILNILYSIKDQYDPILILKWVIENDIKKSRNTTSSKRQWKEKKERNAYHQCLFSGRFFWFDWPRIL